MICCHPIFWSNMFIWNTSTCDLMGAESVDESSLNTPIRGCTGIHWTLMCYSVIRENENGLYKQTWWVAFSQLFPAFILLLLKFTPGHCMSSVLCPSSSLVSHLVWTCCYKWAQIKPSDNKLHVSVSKLQLTCTCSLVRGCTCMISNSLRRPGGTATYAGGCMLH